jgi:L-amino acid N-acyltransferase YncA
MQLFSIRKATNQDHDKIWSIIQSVIKTGETYVFDPGSEKQKMLDYWCAHDAHVYVATDQAGAIAGTYVIRDNRPDLGSHIANGSYMVSPSFEGKGIGRLMGEHSIQEAKNLGYKAMQFNYVISTNERAVKLWQSLGFNIVGKVPEAFYHHRLGYVAVYIMYKKL